jgi:segregation and condensation protein A
MSDEIAVNQDNIDETIQPYDMVERAIGRFRDQPITSLPLDLYIPPEALKIFLEAFEGPLDLLLYLIKKNNIDILDIPIAEITRQYVEYIELMNALELELAADYLVMAASLAEIKSRMMLPRPKNEEGEELDPRAELVRRLQEYERFKKVAVELDELPRCERDIFPANVTLPAIEKKRPLPQVELPDLLDALRDVLSRAQMFAKHHIQREPLSIRERMTHILSVVTADEYTDFCTLFTIAEGRSGVVVTFIAILELLRHATIEMVQAEPFSPIYIKAVAT